MRSQVWMGGAVHFPEWRGDRVYMVPFKQATGLKHRGLDRWEDTVYEMLDGIKTDKDIYLMIDQGIVKAGETHRRPGPHIDGYWMPGVGHGHIHPIGAHGSPGRDPSSHNNPTYERRRGRHDNSHTEGGHIRPEYDPTTGRHGGPKVIRDGKHTSGEDRSELILMASNITGAKAYVGEYDGEFGSGGECNFDLGGMKTINMLGGVSWIGDVYTIHESIPHDIDGLRTLVRLNVPLQ